MTRRRLVLVNVAVVSLLVLAYVAVDRYSTSQTTWTSTRKRADRPAPDFKLPVVAGLPGQAELALASLRGRPAVVNFWASWCTACRAERPALDALRLAASGGSGAVVGVASLDKLEAVQAVEAASPHGYPLVLDADGKVAQTYDVQGLPQTFVIDAHGLIVRHFIGALKASDVEDVKRLLTVPNAR